MASELPFPPGDTRPLASAAHQGAPQAPVAQFVRLAEQGRAPLRFFLDGVARTALHGDTVLTAVLTQHSHLRHTEFSGEPRAGLCLIGACQDCWMRSEDGSRVRACTTLLREDMRLLSGAWFARAADDS